MLAEPPQERRSQARWMLGSGATQALVALGSNLVLMRLLEPSEFGSFAVAMATIAIVFALFSLRLGPVVQRAEQDLLDGDFGALAAGAMLVETVTATALSLGVLTFAGALDRLTLALTLTVAGMHALTQLRGFVERGSPYAHLARIEGTAHMLGHGTALAVASAGFGPGALLAREATLLLAQIAGLGSLVAKRPELRPARPRIPRPADWPRIARRASDSTLDGLLEGLVARSSVLAAGALAGPHGAGLLAQAQRLAAVPHQFLGPLCGRLAFQWFAGARNARERRAIHDRVLRSLRRPLVAAGLGTVLLAPLAVPALFGERWAPAATLLVGLLGVVIGTSPLALVRMRLLAERSLPGLLAQRSTQLLALGLAWGLARAFEIPPLLTLCLGLSAGTLTAIALGLRFVQRPAPAAPIELASPSSAAAAQSAARRSA